AYAPLTSADGVVETHYTVTAIGSGTNAIELVTERGNTGVQGYRCMTFNASMKRRLALQTNAAPYDIAYGPVTLPKFAVGDVETLRFSYGGTLDCQVSSSSDVLTAPEPEARTGLLGIETQNMGAAFDYLVVYEPAP